jgi:hypothetical protein
VAGRHHPPGGEVRIRPGQLDARGQRLQDRHRGFGGGDRFLAAGQLPHDVGETSRGVALAPPVADRTPQFEPAPDGFGRLLGPVEQEQFLG